MESALAVALATNDSSGKKRSSSEARKRSSAGKKLVVEAAVVVVAAAEVVVVPTVTRLKPVEGVMADAVEAVVGAAAGAEVGGGSPQRPRMPSETSKIRRHAPITTGKSKPTRRTKFDGVYIGPSTTHL